MKWNGVMPAITTCFTEKYEVDHAFLADHARWLIENGCTGIVALGSLGEGATLHPAEKLAILKTFTKALKGKAPLVASISALSTPEAVELAKSAEGAGCDGLMILPPYVYKGDWREMKAYVATVLRATSLSCMLYNNPVAYGTDFLPEQIAELAKEHANLAAVKESSTDVRRVTAIRALLGERLAVFGMRCRGPSRRAIDLRRAFAGQVSRQPAHRLYAIRHQPRAGLPAGIAAECDRQAGT